MRLGTFWGFTAPTLLLAYDDTDEISSIIQFMRDSTNSDIIKNLHIELYFLMKSKELAEVSLLPPECGYFSERYPDAFISYGTFVNAGVQDVAQIDLVNEIIHKVAQKILTGESKGKFVKINHTVYDTVQPMISSYIQENEFYSSDVHKIVNKIYRDLLSESGHSAVFIIENEFSCTKALPEKFLRNNVSIESGISLQKIYDYFQHRMSDIEKLFDETKAFSASELKVFNFELSEFLKRKPDYLELLTLNWFDYAIKSKSAIILQQSVEDYRLNLEQLKKAIETSVAVLNLNESSEVKVDHSLPVVPYIDHPTDYTNEELQMINNLFEHAQNFTAEMAAEKLGISAEDFVANTQAACNVGICGLNEQTKELFMDSLNNIVMSDSFVCKKSQEYLNQINQSILNAEQLLRNIKPLGAEI